MRKLANGLAYAIIIAVAIWAAVAREWGRAIPVGRSRVVFWHFWGGAERKVVQDVVGRFNASQDEFWVEEVAIPGENLDMKFYMSLSGGQPPDCLNQDDPVVGQWADRGMLLPLRELASPAEYVELKQWLSPAARRIGLYKEELYALCNGLDIRANLYRDDALEGKPPPSTLAEFDALAKRPTGDPRRLPFLPDDRRLWVYGAVFGGQFYDEATRTVTANDSKIVAALEWMVSYTQHHGLPAIQAFRANNREAGSGSPLLQGRFGMMLDGQWRVPELDSVLTNSRPFDYQVATLPAPPGGLERAGWVNGNFFLVPKGSRNPRGAWAFMKFWSGFGGFEKEAAISSARGGWIPASPRVAERPEFQQYLRDHPKFRTFVELSQSPHQFPTPNLPVQAYFFDRVNQAAQEALALKKSPQQALDEATRDVQAQLDGGVDR